ncbi:hypothetical protein [Nostoc sphaeroides]|nr:hypothetical protein [Nostoc sphaeroides]
MHNYTQIKILDLDDVESIIVQEITVAEAEKIIGGDVPQIKVEPAINECKVLSGGNCSCQGNCRLIDPPPTPIISKDPHPSGIFKPHYWEIINQAINQGYLDKSFIPSKFINKVNLK